MAGESTASHRRTYLDLLRGVAVLLMIDAHLFDSWTRPADRGSAAFAAAMFIGGFGTTLFLMLAGVASALSAGSKLRRGADVRSASQAVIRRGLELYALALIFRVQAWFLGWSHSPGDLLKVDILNIMGPSIVFAGLLWRAGRTASQRLWLFTAATLATAVITPFVSSMPTTVLPDALRAYVVPVPGLSNFVFFPWMALVFAGGVIGMLLDSAVSAARERQVNVWLGAGGAAVAVFAFAASYLPSALPDSSFWTTSPAFLFIRIGVVSAAVAIAYVWSRISGPGWSPLGQLGRTSLFIYWIHVEMVYGLISLPLHHSLSIRVAAASYVLFCAFMLLCSIGKDAVVSRYGRGRVAVAAAPFTLAQAPTRSRTGAE
jgi:uncharacterized membrane protein